MHDRPSASPAYRRAYTYLHIAVLLFGFTAILGRYITLSGTMITVYRMSLTLISLCFFPRIFSAVRSIPARDRLRILGIGVLMALHWATFFEAIKLSNVSITLSCFASTAFFTALIEPLFFKGRVNLLEVLLGCVVVVGFSFVFGIVGAEYWQGIVVAVISAIIISLANVFNKSMVQRYDVFAVTWLEFIAGVAFLLAMLPFFIDQAGGKIWPTGQDWIALLILALLCTTLAYTLNMKALKHVSAYTAALTINLEPVYGIMLAYLIFQENQEVSPGFYI
ncbi:MAG: EamA family transporter, partial [Bacteroidota bacterium]